LLLLSTTHRDFLTKISGFAAEGVFNSPWKFHRSVFIASRIAAFTVCCFVLEVYFYCKLNWTDVDAATVDRHLWSLSQSVGSFTATDTHRAGETEYDWTWGVHWDVHCRKETQCKLSLTNERSVFVTLFRVFINVFLSCWRQVSFVKNELLVMLLRCTVITLEHKNVYCMISAVPLLSVPFIKADFTKHTYRTICYLEVIPKTVFESNSLNVLKSILNLHQAFLPTVSAWSLNHVAL